MNQQRLFPVKEGEARFRFEPPFALLELLLLGSPFSGCCMARLVRGSLGPWAVVDLLSGCQMSIDRYKGGCRFWGV